MMDHAHRRGAATRAVHAALYDIGFRVDELPAVLDHGLLATSTAILDALTPEGRRAVAAYLLTIDDVAEAVCISEVAGSGHDSGVPCGYHDATSVKVQRLYDSLADPDRLARYHEGGDEDDGD